MSQVLPFIPYVGGKRYLARRIVPSLPAMSGEYWEPFVGGGAMFFTLRPQIAHLSDLNHDLIRAYLAVRDNHDAVAARIAEWQKTQDMGREYGRELFLKIRKQFNSRSDKTDLESSIEYIYLLNASFGGILQRTKSRYFCNSYGMSLKKVILNPKTLLNASMALQKSDISARHYTDISPKRGDFVYLDPPYLHAYDRFYSHAGDEKATKMEFHVELRDFCQYLDKAGVFWMQSNAYHADIERLYKNYCIKPIGNLFMAPRKEKSRYCQESIISNFELNPGSFHRNPIAEPLSLAPPLYKTS